MQQRGKTAIVSMLAALLLPTLLAAEEVPPRHYSAPIGLTEADALRIVIAPAPMRIEGPAAVCQTLVKVEILDALDMGVLATFGPLSISPGASFLADFTATVRARPERREVIVSATIKRAAHRSAERGSLDAICPLLGSIQLYDRATSRTIGHIGSADLTWSISEASPAG